MLLFETTILACAVREAFCLVRVLTNSHRSKNKAKPLQYLPTRTVNPGSSRPNLNLRPLLLLPSPLPSLPVLNILFFVKNKYHEKKTKK